MFDALRAEWTIFSRPKISIYLLFFPGARFQPVRGTEVDHVHPSYPGDPMPKSGLMAGPSVP